MKTGQKNLQFIRIARILINIGTGLFFSDRLSGHHQEKSQQHFTFCLQSQLWCSLCFDCKCGCFPISFVALSKEWSGVKLHINKTLWKEVMIYALPLTIAGFAGMINETFDRVMLQRWSPLKGDAATFEVGIYSACYKLSILITLFVQAFRMGAEPFFFKQSTEDNAPQGICQGNEIFCAHHLLHVFGGSALPGCLENTFYPG